MQYSFEITELAKSYDFTEQEVVSFSPLQSIINRLWEKYSTLGEVIEDTENHLEFCRLRRKIWNDWSVIIDTLRSEEDKRFLNASASDLREDNWQAIRKKIPKTFSDLNQNISEMLKQKDELSEYKEFLCGK